MELMMLISYLKPLTVFLIILPPLASLTIEFLLTKLWVILLMEHNMKESEPELLVLHKTIGSDQVEIQEVLVLELLGLFNLPGVIIEKLFLIMDQFQLTGKFQFQPEQLYFNN
jgi:hypothetical protein